MNVPDLFSHRMTIAEVAARDYRDMCNSLCRMAAEVELQGYTYWGAELRAMAVIALKASRAEIMDPEPRDA